MGLIERLFGRAGGAPAATTAGPVQVSPQAVPYVDTRTILGLSAVWRCITIIADAIADCPWTEWRGEEELEPSRLIKRPMATMTRREWTWRVVATEALANTCYLLHVGGTDSEGMPWSLMPVAPAAIYPTGPQDPWGMYPSTTYVVAGMNVTIDDLTIVRRAPFPGIPDYLNAILNLARRDFSMYMAADVAASRYWQAGGPVTTVITTDQELDDEQAEGIANRWMNRRSMGSDYPAVLGKGATASAWGADPTSESAVEARKDINADVGRYFGVPTRLLNAPTGDSETYANVEQEAVDLERYALRGYMGPIEDAVSELLPGDYIGGRRMRFDSSRLTQGDLATRAKAYAELVAAGIFTEAEARTKGFGLPATPSTPTTPAAAVPFQALAPAGSSVAVTAGPTSTQAPIR